MKDFRALWSIYEGNRIIHDQKTLFLFLEAFCGTVRPNGRNMEMSILPHRCPLFYFKQHSVSFLVQRMPYIIGFYIVNAIVTIGGDADATVGLSS